MAIKGSDATSKMKIANKDGPRRRSTTESNSKPTTSPSGETIRGSSLWSTSIDPGYLIGPSRTGPYVKTT